ncbi:DUF2155 domain-containing protein [Cognatishimia maritima]|uniref:DUF2155 domain-containing protein n=1 Tax=Cognatishimia maritima TaxID=870908 RepID=A0A1M5VCH3_9RHOB|nr:DUF2155 domain-containing protein [Cognatishimia maritima]SHH72613.1 hypothetical protein SAMN04488044_3106 [Cognatishimia maritima]
MKWLAGIALCFCCANVSAQEIIIEELNGLEDGISLSQSPIFEDVVEEVTAVPGTGAVLRGLDKLSGHVEDFELQNGFSVGFGQLRIDLAECRHPDDNATGEAYAFLTIFDGPAVGEPAFQGWMIASSPALNAMDHARYDIWVLRCTTAPEEGSE